MIKLPNSNKKKNRINKKLIHAEDKFIKYGGTTNNINALIKPKDIPPPVHFTGTEFRLFGPGSRN